MLALNAVSGKQLLMTVWIFAFAGILQSIFWVKAPKYVTSLFYIVMGWLALPYLSELKQALGFNQVLLILVGGIVYTIGALFYATRSPKLRPTIFGYHELFHLFTIIAAGFHFAVIYQRIK